MKLDKSVWRRWAGYMLFLTLFCCIPLLPVLQSEMVRKVQVQGPPAPSEVHEMIAGDVVRQRLFFRGSPREFSFLVANGARPEGVNAGKLRVMLEQDGQRVEQEFDISEFGDWVDIPLELNSSRLKAGEAVLTIESMESEPGHGIYLVFASDPVDCLPAVLNGINSNAPLVLNYQEFIIDSTVTASLLWMMLMMLLIGWCSYLLAVNRSGIWLFLMAVAIMFCEVCIRAPSFDE